MHLSNGRKKDPPNVIQIAIFWSENAPSGNPDSDKPIFYLNLI
jgi:hypothetical protein